MARTKREKEGDSNTSSTPIIHRRRDIMLRSIKRYEISQREISRRTKALQQAGQGNYVDPHQLNKFLHGHNDLTAMGIEALEIALTQVDPRAGAYYQGEIMRMLNEFGFEPNPEHKV